VRDHRLRDEEIAVVATDEAIIAGNGDTDNKAIVSQSFTVEISIIAVILQSLLSAMMADLAITLVTTGKLFLSSGHNNHLSVSLSESIQKR